MGRQTANNINKYFINLMVRSILEKNKARRGRNCQGVAILYRWPENMTLIKGLKGMRK